MNTSRSLHFVLPSLVIVAVAILSTVAIHGTAVAGPDSPTGWIHAGNAPADYDMGADPSNAHAGKASGYLKSKSASPAGFGTLMQMSKADQFLGKRVRMSGWAKSDNVAKWAGLWMRVDGPDKSRSLAFDNMQSRPIKGTSGWTQYQVVLDVAPEAKDIAFGILLDGTGGVWLDDLHFEVVDASVPTTGMGSGQELAAKPVNLDFEN